MKCTACQQKRATTKRGLCPACDYTAIYVAWVIYSVFGIVLKVA